VRLSEKLTKRASEAVDFLVLMEGVEATIHPLCGVDIPNSYFNRGGGGGAKINMAALPILLLYAAV
jgi:hypothetical protein